MILLHHPKGILKKKEGSLASHWGTWNSQFNNVLEIVCLEIIYMQKNHKQNDIILKANDDFYTLAANIYFQVSFF